MPHVDSERTWKLHIEARHLRRDFIRQAAGGERIEKDRDIVERNSRSRGRRPISRELGPYQDSFLNANQFRTRCIDFRGNRRGPLVEVPREIPW